jgi:hypothetical protein
MVSNDTIEAWQVSRKASRNHPDAYDIPRALGTAKRLVAKGLFSIENPMIYLDLADLGYPQSGVSEAIMAAFTEIEEADSRPSKEKEDPPAHQFVWNSKFFECRMLLKFSLKGMRPNCLIWGMHVPAYDD